MLFVIFYVGCFDLIVLPDMVFDSTKYPTKYWSGIQKRAMTMIAYKILMDCFWSKIALWEWNPI